MWAALVGGAVAAAAATALAGSTRRLVERAAASADTHRPDSLWLRTAVLAAVAAVAGVAAGLGAGTAWEVPALVTVAVVSALLCCGDLASLTIPNRILFPGYLATVAGLLLAAVALGGWGRLGTALLGGLVLMLVYFAIGWIRPQDFGLGDVKLGLLVGTVLGWSGWGHVLLGGAGAFIVYALGALVVLALRRGGLRTELPMGPAILVAMWLTVLLGPSALG